MIESLLAEIAEAGWLVNNLFQLRNGSWQCNLYRGGEILVYGWGSTATAALAEAIDQFTARALEPEIDFSGLFTPKPIVKLNLKF